MLPTPTFSRDFADKLGSRSISMSDTVYSTLMRARILSTRGVGADIAENDIPALLDEIEACRLWVNELCLEIEENG